MSGPQQRMTPMRRLKARLQDESHKRWVLDAADRIIDGRGDLPGEHLVRMIMRHLKYYVDPVGYWRSLHPMKVEVMRADLAAAIAKNRRKRINGKRINAPVTKARTEVAKKWGVNSGEALRRALQPSRVNLKPRRRPRG
jgi:hypothetical protein